MAFVPVSTSGFTGTKVSPSGNVCSLAPSRTSMKADEGMNKMLQKYSVMSTTPPQPNVSSKPSTIWMAYTKSVLEKVSPTRSAMFTEAGSFSDMIAQLKYLATVSTSKAPGGDPRNLAWSRKADEYMANCVTAQYKMTACPNGVYGVQCTEGTTKFQAEDSRVMALATRFRLGQRSAVQKYGDFFETRRQAIAAAHECSYEEKLSAGLPQVSSAIVRGQTEAKSICVRYADGSTPEEQYMAAAVDKQIKFRAVPYGVYDVLCQDGSVSGMAEYKRVQALSAKFRANQMSPLAKEQAKYDAASYARSNFSHMCDYEEVFFNKFPAIAASMRPSTVRY